MLEVLIEIKDRIDSAIVLITHDLGVVAGVADRVMVMYAGRQVELGTTDEIFYEPRHPYTLGLLAVVARASTTPATNRCCRSPGQPPSLIRRRRAARSTRAAAFARCPVCAQRGPELASSTGDAAPLGVPLRRDARGRHRRLAAGQG